MRINQIIQEVPIDSYQTVGNFDKSSSYRDARDRRLVTDPKMIKRTETKFLNTPHDLSFIFVNSPSANKHTEVGKVSREWVSTNLGDEVAEAVDKARDDTIIFIFTNNKGAERFVMTPWIMAHRMGHALQRPDLSSFGTRIKYQNPYFREAHESLIESLSRILEVGYNKDIGGMRGVDNVTGNRSTTRRNQLLIKNLAQDIGTFRSARKKELRDWFEFINELFAQWATTGQLKFNPLPDRITSGNKILAVKTSNTDDWEDANDILQMLANDMDYHFDAALGASYNDIYVM